MRSHLATALISQTSLNNLDLSSNKDISIENTMPDIAVRVSGKTNLE